MPSNCRKFGPVLGALIFVCGLAPGAATQPTTLRIGLMADPDNLDPTTSRSWSTVIVLNSICDKLIDVTPDLRIVPQLATEWSWSEDHKALQMKLRAGVKFHDGEPFNAAAVKYTIERHLRTRGSILQEALRPITGVDVIDDLTVRINLSSPISGPLFSRFVIGAGMIVSPKAAETAGEQFGARPVCAGPYRFVERVALDHITLERFPDYWDKNRVHIDRITYRIMADSTVRLANLRAGALDLIEQVAPTDVTDLLRNSRFKIASAMSLGYNRISINVGKSDRAHTPFGRDARIRQAFNLAIDREAINQVAFNGEAVPANSWIPPGSPLYLATIAAPRRDVARAKDLLAAAGVPNPKVELTLHTIPVQSQVAELIQAMTREAGFDTKLVVLETGSAIQAGHRGDHQAYLNGWPGFLDPDHNIFSMLHCKGSLNYSGYCNNEVDGLLEKARAMTDVAERVRLYTRVREILAEDEPYIFLNHLKLIWAHAARLRGFVPHRDGLMRVLDLKLD